MSKYSLVSLTLGLMLCGGVMQASGMPAQLGGASQATIGGAPLNVLSLTTSEPRGAITFVGGTGSKSVVSPFPDSGLTTSGTQVKKMAMSMKSVVMPTSGTVLTDQPITVGGLLTKEPLAKVSLTQMMPPAPVNYVPNQIKNLMVMTPTGETSDPQPATTTVPEPGTVSMEIAGKRPDFRYHSGRIEFQPQTTHTTGQLGMGVGPGLPPGVVRYVPVGEF